MSTSFYFICKTCRHEIHIGKRVMVTIPTGKVDQEKDTEIQFIWALNPFHFADYPEDDFSIQDEYEDGKVVFREDFIKMVDECTEVYDNIGRIFS